MILYIISAALFLGFILILRMRKKDGIETEIKPPVSIRNPYQGLRNTAFRMRPEMLGIGFSTDALQVYGLIIEWEIQGAVVSLVCYQTGDTSLYVSTGGAIIGGGKYPEVSVKAVECVQMADQFLSQTEENESHNLPEKGGINFYFLTNQGVRLYSTQLAYVEKGESEFTPLFNQGNKLLNELRRQNYN